MISLFASLVNKNDEIKKQWHDEIKTNLADYIIKPILNFTLRYS